VTAGTESDSLRLEVIDGQAVGDMIEVGDRIVFGRQSEGPGRLADDPELSRHHAEISRGSGGEYSIEDLASTNGTFVNGARLQTPAVLSKGDMIEVGTTRLVVRETPAVALAVDPRAATVTVDVPPALRAPAPEEPAAPAGAAAVTEEAPAAQAPATEEQVPAEEAPPATEPPAPAEDVLLVDLPARPPVEIRLVIDFEQAEATIALGSDGELVRLCLVEGRWRLGDGEP
jgi:pSer/pThr/pTyr-binding forkhead associated (FHA) protein